MRETFYIDGIDASSVGIQLQSPIEFSEPIPVVETDLIDGRNGEIVYETGSYENRTANASCFLLQTDVLDAVASANKFLLAKHGYRRLETSDSPDCFWLARIANGARIEQRIRTLAPFNVEFSCKPQRFMKSGEEIFNFNQSGSIFNQYFFDAKPLITVFGNGSGTLYVGGVTVNILDMNDVIYLDSEMQNAYNNNGYQNVNILASEFPVLKSGENNISFTGGITSISIKPRWWVL